MPYRAHRAKVVTYCVLIGASPSYRQRRCFQRRLRRDAKGVGRHNFPYVAAEG